MKTLSDLKEFDLANWLQDEDQILDFLDEAMQSGDPHHIADALGVAARAKGMTDIARKAGVTRPALYAALSGDGNPTLETLAGVINALGLRLRVDRAAA
jgi:probable addiction module antidote protein